MADAGITVTIDADASKFEAEYRKVLGEMAAGQKTASDGAKYAAAANVRAIEEEIAANTLWKNSVNSTQLTEADALLTKERAIAMAKFAAVAEKENAAANLEDAAAAKVNAAANKSLAKILGTVVIVLKDLARGQWGRAISSAITAVQSLWAGLTALLPVLIPIVIVGYAVITYFKELAQSAAYLADNVGQATERLRAHAQAMRDAAKEAASFSEWLEKLHEIRHDDSLTSQAEADVKAMHKRFEMEQHAARGRGQTQEQALNAQKIEAKKEADFLKARSDAAGKLADRAEADAVNAEKKYAPTVNKKQEDLKVSEAAAQHAEQILGEVSAQYGLQTSGGALGRLFMSEGFAGTLSSLANKKDQKIKLSNGNFVTLNEALLQYKAATALQTADQATLAAAQRPLEDSKRLADKRARDAANLARRAESSEDSAEALKNADTSGADRQRTHISAVLNNLQRIGGFAGFSVQGIDIQHTISRNVAAIRSMIEHHNTRSTGGRHSSVESYFGPG